MIPNMRFFVISIVAIFVALGIGIYIGLAFDTQSIVMEQREDIVQKLEEKFDFFKKENHDLKLEIKELELVKEQNKIYIESTYEELLKNRLSGIKIGIIETVDDYMYSGIGQTLEAAGGSVVNVITINEKLMDKDHLSKIYKQLDMETENIDLIANTTALLTESILNGEESDLILQLEENQIIHMLGFMEEPVDYLVLAGGSVRENKDRIALIDKTIINTSKNMKKPIVGIEKFKVNYSYIGEYKELGINTVDNIDMVMGKVSLVLAMEGRPGHYGVKPTAEAILPNLKLPLIDSSEER